MYLLSMKSALMKKSDTDHLKRILEICGTPDEEFMSKIHSDSVSCACMLFGSWHNCYVSYLVPYSAQARTYVSSLPHFERKNFSKLFPGASAEAVDLLDQLLCMDPDRRPTAAQALEYPYLERYYCPDDEVCCGWFVCSCVHLHAFIRVSVNPSDADLDIVGAYLHE